jgi:hypothetical protein
MRKTIMIKKNRDQVELIDERGTKVANVFIAGHSRNVNALLCVEMFDERVKATRTPLRQPV